MSDDPDPADRRFNPPPEPETMEWLQANFCCDGNPVFVWRALALAHDWQEPLPAWIAGYLLQAAQEIVRMSNEATDGKSVPRQANRVGQALGFGNSGAGKSVFRDAATIDDDHEMYFQVMSLAAPAPEHTADGRLLFRPGEKLDFAYEIVAGQAGVDPTTVSRAVGRSIARFDGGNSDSTDDSVKARVAELRELYAEIVEKANAFVERKKGRHLS